MTSDALALGRQKRAQQLKQYRDDIPSLKDLYRHGLLDVQSWFFHYRKLMDFGAREIFAVDEVGNELVITYSNYVKHKKELFTVSIPRKLLVNDDFLYFFGLWLGDKASGGRLGVVNKNPSVNYYTEQFLKRYHQQIVKDLYIGAAAPLPSCINTVDKITRIKGKVNGWAIGIYTINGILRSFFKYLEAQLDDFLSIIPDKRFVFAGLFDAEGNVFLEDRCFRWSCCSEHFRTIYRKHLSDLGLYSREDRKNFVTLDRNAFQKHIYPYLKHPEKLNACRLLFEGEGELPPRFAVLAAYVEANPGLTQKELAKALKRVKVSSQLKVLERLYIIRSESYPKMYYTTAVGNGQEGRT